MALSAVTTPYVEHTCPNIDLVGEVIHRHVAPGSPDWEQAMRLLEKLRRDNRQLRDNAELHERQAREANHKFLRVLHQLSSPIRGLA
jgi:hypothetical protein